MEKYLGTYMFEVRKEEGFSFSSPALPLYARAIGARAIGLYMYLCSYPKKEVGVCEKAFADLSFSPTEWSNEIASLEATGLLVTRKREEKGSRFFYYLLKSPLSINEFVLDPGLSSLYEKAAGKGSLDKYLRGKKNELGVDVTTSFSSLYGERPSAESAFAELSPRLGGTRFFDRSKFKEALESDRIVAYSDISEKEMKRLEKAASVYALSEESFASLVERHFNQSRKIGERIDFAGLFEEAKTLQRQPLSRRKEDPLPGKTYSEEEMDKVNSLSAEQYLRYKQKGHAPAKQDLDIVIDLRDKMGLPDPAVNALVLYTLIELGNELPRKYMEKIAGQLVREGVETGEDTVNAILARNSKLSEKNKAKLAAKPVKKSEPAEEPESEEGDENLEELLEALYKDE